MFLVKCLIGLSKHKVNVTSDICSITSELVILILFQLLNSGITSHDIDIIKIFFEYLDSIEDLKLKSVQIKLAIFIYESIVLLNPIVLNSNFNIDGLRERYGLESMITFTIQQFSDQFNQLLSSLVAIKTSQNAYFLAILNINMNLLASKVMFYKYFNCLEALQSIKNCLSHSFMSIVSNNDKEDSKIKGQLVDLGVYQLKVNGLLFVAELYDHCGNVDNCLSYISEAVSLAKYCESSSLSSIVSLHTIRIWYRLSSPRVVSLVQDVMTISDFSRVEVNGKYPINLS